MLETFRKVLRSTAFRLAGFYILIFGVAGAGLLSMVYWRSTVFTAQQIDQTITAEIQGLNERFRSNGVPGLTKVVAERSRRQSQSLYLLVDPSGRRLAGNVDVMPPDSATQEGWTDFAFRLNVGGEVEKRVARGRIMGVAGGHRLLVGRDVQQREDLLGLLKSAFWWATGGILALGILGGLVISRHTLKRVDAIAAASEQIMAGDLSRRVPRDGSGDELDRLAESLNAMLERIEGLMTAVRQVSDNIAHDLRTPLNRLRARVEVALMTDSSAPHYREALEKTLHDSDTLLATFNALLDIARLEGAADAGPSDRITLATIVTDVAELYDPVAEEAGIALTVDPLEAAAIVIGDRRLLAQALANLIDNAIKYTPAGGEVRVGAYVRDGRPALIVQDNGPGVPDSERERIFDRFVRLEADRGKPGNGLGLSLVRAVATMHGARIDAEDARPGLKIAISLPPAPAPASVSAEAAE